MLTAPHNPHTWIQVENERGDGTNHVRPVEGERPDVPRRRWPVRDHVEPGTAITIEVGQANHHSLKRTNRRDVAIEGGSKTVHGWSVMGEPFEEEWLEAGWDSRRC